MSNGYTNLQPNKLKSKNSITNKSIDIDLEKIEISDNNIKVTISALGLQSTNPTGLRMDCTLDMHENDITNINTSGYYNGINIYDNNNNSIIGNSSDLILSSDKALSLITTNGIGNHINIKSGADIILENTVIGGGGLVATMDYIQLIATNQYINLDALNNITLTSSNGDVNLDASNNINITSSNGEVNLSGISFNLSSTDSTISDSGGGLEIISTSSVSLISGTNEAIILNSGDYIEMNPNTYINMTAGQQINLSSGLLFDIILDTANLKFINGIQITDDIDNNRIIGDSEKLEISSKGVLSLKTISGVGLNNDININSAGTNNITSVGNLTLSAPDIFTNCQGLQLDAGSYITLQVSSGGITLNSSNEINMTAQNNFITLTASTDITIQSVALGTINTNAPNSNSYGNALPICLNQFEQGTWSYTLGGQVFQDVFSGSPITIALPPQFFAENTTYTSTRWQINFDMNCWNFVNAGDKGFAIYLSFLDSNGNLYEPFLYNNLTPYCKWDNAPGFNGAFPYTQFNQFKSINFCDYIDFGGLVGSNDSNIRLQMNIAGDNVFNNVDFKFKLGFTRIQRV